MTEALSALPVSKQAERYRELAAEAEANAQRACAGDVRDGYRKLARNWVELARQVERTFDCSPEESDFSGEFPPLQP